MGQGVQLMYYFHLNFKFFILSVGISPATDVMYKVGVSL